jgi:hypothetical protein
VKRITVALMLTLVVVLGATACAPSKPSVADTRAACFANQKLIAAEMDLFHADAGIFPPISDVVQKLGLKCPAGGTYSFDATTDVITCSVHGHP